MHVDAQSDQSVIVFALYSDDSCIRVSNAVPSPKCLSKDACPRNRRYRGCKPRRPYVAAKHLCFSNFRNRTRVPAILTEVLILP